MNITCYVIQFPISLDIKNNLSIMLSCLNRLPKDALVLFPEGCLSGYSQSSSFLNAINTEILHQCLLVLQEKAFERSVHLTFGSCLYEDGFWYNAGLYFGPNKEKFIYKKLNLATSERGAFAVGNELSCFEIAHEDCKIKLGFQLCREIRYPEQWRYLADSGAQIFVYATNAVGDKKIADIWRSHLISRAAENQRFVLCANASDAEQKCPSMIIAPDGGVLWEALSESTLMGSVVIDLSEVSNLYLDQRRKDLF